MSWLRDFALVSIAPTKESRILNMGCPAKTPVFKPVGSYGRLRQLVRAHRQVVTDVTRVQHGRLPGRD